jgi:hypothetical protein
MWTLLGQGAVALLWPMRATTVPRADGEVSGPKWTVGLAEARG